MSKEIAPANPFDLNVLSELVERQLDEVAGGGYSQVSAHHNKDRQVPTPELD